MTSLIDRMAGVAQGHSLLGQGCAPDALAAAEAVLAGLPECVEAMILRAAALKAQGRYAEAAIGFQSALLREPMRPAVRVSLGNTLAELGRLPEAETALRRALALQPRLAAAHASLITVCAMMNRDDLTLAACLAALAVDPEAVNAHQHLADLRARAGDHAEARRHREAAYRRTSWFVEKSIGPAPTVLVLLTTENGNVPLKYLLSHDRYRVIRWMIEYATPEQEAQLPPYDFVFNAIGEPELPASTLSVIERFHAGCSKPFLNTPQRVARTRRALLPDLLAGLDDVVVPQVWRWQAGEPLPPCDGPALVRPVGSHGGEGLEYVATQIELEAAAEIHPACDITRFHDYASPDRLFRKYRVMFIDRRPYAYHLAISDRWLVHYVTADMLYHPARRAEEARFLNDPMGVLGAKAWAALTGIAGRLDLDYAGIDFSLLPDGRVLVFEANATMVVHPENPVSVLRYKNAAVQNILTAFDQMAGIVEETTE